MSGHAAACDRKARKFGKHSAGEMKGGHAAGSAAADDENPMEALDFGREMGPPTEGLMAEDEAGKAHLEIMGCMLAAAAAQHSNRREPPTHSGRSAEAKRRREDKKKSQTPRAQDKRLRACHRDRRLDLD